MKRVAAALLCRQPTFRRRGRVCFALLLAAAAGGAPARARAEQNARAAAAAQRVEWLKRNAVGIRSVDPADVDWSDLRPLGAALGGARVVLLGEQTHGDAEAFSAKVRLVKFLHQELGFDVLAFESGFYDGAKIWHNVKAGAPTGREVIGSLFYMYATSRQVKPLFDYVDAQRSSPRPLVLTAVDSQHTGEKSIQHMMADLERFLAAKGSRQRDTPAWAEFKATAIGVFRSREFRPDGAREEAFFRTLAAVQEELKRLPPENEPLLSSPGFWLQVLKSIDSQTRRYWGRVEDVQRDEQMADNLLWLARGPYAGRKIVVWAHNFHVSRVPVGASGSMGFHLDRALGPEMYVIGFVGGQGRYLDFVTNTPVEIPPPAAGSLDDLWSATGQALAFADFRRLGAAGAWMNAPLAGRFADYRPLEQSWPRAMDGAIFVRRVSPAVREPEPPKD